MDKETNKRAGTPAHEGDKAPFVWPGMKFAFILLVTCFAAWGISTDLTAPLVNVFKSVFDMSTVQSSLVQFAYFGAYFCLAIPAAWINSRLGYKGGVVIGLSLAAIGALLFFPASKVMTFGMFLAALFVLAGGLSIVETSANPFIMAMGPEKTATRRLNFAQAFNPIGSNIGVLAATFFILPYVHEVKPEEKAAMSPEQLLDKQSAELGAVMAPYIVLGLFYLFLAICIAMVKIQKRQNIVADSKSGIQRQPGVFGRLLKNPLYSFGVVAQFCNIAAQSCIWTYIIFYAEDYLHVSKATAGWWLQFSLICFLVMRFLMVWIMGIVDPRFLLIIMTGLGAVFTFVGIVSHNVVGMICIAALSACISLLFPTIYGIALHGVGPDTKYGSAGLVMSIIGGAIIPVVQGHLRDVSGTAMSFSVVLICFIVICLYGIYALKHDLEVDESNSFDAVIED
ncbi:L-fucose:H+ symporter permease [Actinotignum urinale]|uniref:L-fucose:H+ symporter permease n=4 Tax=Actinotignum urinale TaxID=190146 RepID=A0ABU5G5P6_9ACTO|nr:L-fucose:H+ symporter permease [Actinotignum urinale]MDY5132470.1 L-fucose:H+ symporter permease [Actinotignum urinale]MDY5151052.1 L-fucose:H+ symporter permease [Actinotignum urinale]WIK58676.1 L-fucose:H+ symporter permease [Actinotignum urinale]